MVSWRESEGGDRPRDDITALVLGLARNLSPEDMATQLAALRLTMEGHGDAGLDAFVVERVDTVLTLRGYSEELKLGGAKTMAEMVDRFHARHRPRRDVHLLPVDGQPVLCARWRNRTRVSECSAAPRSSAGRVFSGAPPLS